MKKLTRIKLINWHRFSNVTIEFGSSTLLSGENGAGKTTLLDAIQFVITCSTNSFNKAAHENGKRKLTGYIRCKTGRERQPYERTGEISAHVALEFYEESKKQYFVVGAVIDSATEGQETVVRYLLDNCMFTDEMFCVDNKPRTIADFRAFNAKKLKAFVKTQAEAKKMLKQRFGRIDDKFFQLIPKALAFKPIDDIKDFVYSYVLDEKQVNIDSLRENVRSYQELEKTLESVKKRIAKLAEIERHYNSVVGCLKADDMYEYFLAHADLDLTEEEIEKCQQDINLENNKLQECNSVRTMNVQEKEQKTQLYTTLLVEVQKNEEYRALEEQKKNVEALERQEQVQLKERKNLLQWAHKALDKAVQLRQEENIAACIADYELMLRNLKNEQDVVAAKALMQKVIAYKHKLREELQVKLSSLRLDLEKQTQIYLAVETNLKNLERKRFSYPEQVVVLRDTIQQEFLRLGRTAEPRVLCELLDLVNEKWRNAVEGYLNTQRFYVLVEPDHFDIALSIYEGLRREKKVYGVGLINTGKLEAYITTPGDSLATMVESKNIYAKNYINMILGKVHLCEAIGDLKKYPISITSNCMRYQNHVASAISPKIYEHPFIGQNAIRIQLAQAKEKLQEINAKKSKLQENIKQIEHILPLLVTQEDYEIQYGIDIVPELNRTTMLLKESRAELAELEKHATYMDKQLQIDALKTRCKELEKAISDGDRKIGSCEHALESLNTQLREARERAGEARGYLSELQEKHNDNSAQWLQEYDRQNKGKTHEQFRTNFDRRKKANWTQKETFEKELTTAMVDYKTAFDFGAPALYESYQEYAAVQDRLINSELLNYEEKVQKARMSAEEEFREQFLSKLQENMKNAQNEFKELNKALEGIVFSKEKYEFLHTASKKHRKFYDMIMDDFNAAQGQSIFSGVFHENHKEVIDELFAKLALDQDNGVKALAEFTDYRTYMDYDIKIVHEDNNFSLYSKVCEEKSGGETQTPFYVTVAASFVQLYSNNIGGEAIGLIMFDEAFNNMDDERIDGVLEFLNRLPLQIIISAPPDKIQYIGPKMEETLLVLTDKKLSVVEEYKYDGLGH